MNERVFKLMKGSYFAGETLYCEGDLVWSSRSLDTLFPDKFERTESFLSSSVGTSGEAPSWPVRSFSPSITIATFLWGAGVRDGGNNEDYVRRLYQGVSRNLTLPFKFVLFTDTTNRAIRVPEGAEKRLLKVPSFEGCLPKLFAHSPEAKLSGRIMVMDLDTIITGPLDELFSFSGEFISRADELSLRMGHPPRSGGGMQMFNAGTFQYIWDEWKKDPQEFHRKAWVGRFGGCERKIVADYVPREKQKFWQVEFPGKIRHARRELHLDQLPSAPLPEGLCMIISSGSLRPHRLAPGPASACWIKHDRRVRLHPVRAPDKSGINQLEGLLRYYGHLRGEGIDFVSRESEADMLFVHAVRRENGKLTPEGLPRSMKPMVVLEKIDGAQIAPEHREWIQDPRVVAWIKGYTFRDRATHNEPSIEGRYHMAKIAPELAKPPTVKLSDSELKKVSACWGFARYNTMLPFMRSDWQNENRPTDVLFFGRDYTVMRQDLEKDPVVILRRHRTDLIRKLRSMSGLTIAASGKKIPLHKYIDLCIHSKVIVSPWGMGEPCYRDFEAMACGCAVVKPACDWVMGSPDIFMPMLECCIFCKPDWSDLGDAIQKALAWRTKEHVAFNRSLMEAEWDEMQHVRRVARLIHAAMERTAA